MSVFQQMNRLSNGSEFSRNLPSSYGVLQYSNSTLGNFNEKPSTRPMEATEDSFANEVTGSEETAAIPEMALAQMAQNVGSGLNSIINTITNNNISTQYQNSLSTGHGIGLVQMAQNQATSAYAKSSLEDIGGKLGAMFGGPLGALAGRGIASLFEHPVTGAIANSPTGTFNPQSGTTPQSQSSITSPVQADLQPDQNHVSAVTALASPDMTTPATTEDIPMATFSSSPDTPSGDDLTTSSV